jgi:TatD DNase family protein
MKYVDSHAHVNFNSYKDDHDEVMRRSLALEIGIINVGSQYKTSARAVAMTEQYDNVWAVVGIHPLHLCAQKLEYVGDDEVAVTEIEMSGEEYDSETYFKLAKNPKVVAIGEIGLDYHHFEAGDDVEAITAKQKKVLIECIKLANRVNKPVALHCWDAYSDLLHILMEHPVKKLGVVHSFVGGYKTAKKFIELGYKIGLNGVITYGDSFDRLVKEIGLENIILETDCPYLTPMPRKGERNEPLGVIAVAQRIADIKGVSGDMVAEITTKNSKDLFNL